MAQNKFPGRRLYERFTRRSPETDDHDVVNRNSLIHSCDQGRKMRDLEGMLRVVRIESSTPYLHIRIHIRWFDYSSNRP